MYDVIVRNNIHCINDTINGAQCLFYHRNRSDLLAAHHLGKFSVLFQKT